MAKGQAASNNFLAQHRPKLVNGVKARDISCRIVIAKKRPVLIRLLLRQDAAGTHPCGTGTREEYGRRSAFEDIANSIFLGTISSFEIIQKWKIGKLPCPDPQAWLDEALQGFEILPISESIARVGGMCSRGGTLAFRYCVERLAGLSPTLF